MSSAFRSLAVKPIVIHTTRHATGSRCPRQPESHGAPSPVFVIRCWTEAGTIEVDASLLERDQFDFKNQKRIRSDFLAGSLRPIGDVRRNIQFEFRSRVHQLQRFGPSRNHLVDTKLDLLISGFIKDGAVKQCAPSPSTSTSYCKPLGVDITPSLALFSARN